jgi:N-acetylneuraminate synthase/sialic acid synthase
MRRFEIGEYEIAQDSKPFIIAEIGNNHNGSVALCRHLITEAKKNGADAVKLQKRNPKTLFTKRLYHSPYPGENSFGPTYGEHREALEFDAEQWAELFDHAAKTGIMLFATPFDVESVDFLEMFNPPAYKIASGCLTDIPLIQYVARIGKPMIISTGGGTWEDIDRAHEAACNGVRDHERVCLLHCVASYPNRAADMNLRIIPRMMSDYPFTVIGLSDHYQGYNMALAAYCMGARVFEKHFTSDHTLPGPDHALSIEPHELNEWVHEMDRLRSAMGDGEKVLRECERRGIYKMGKGVWPTRTIPAGTVLTEADIAIRSPAEGMAPHEASGVIGRVTVHELSTAAALTNDDVE